MKVCHISSAHPRNDIRIFHKECKSLANNGFEVYLIVADSIGNNYEEGINIIDVGLQKNRIKRWMLNGNKIFKEIIKIKPEVVHFHDPDLLFIANKLIKLNIKVIYDVHEDVPRQIIDKPYLNKFTGKIISFLYEIFENYSAKRFSAIATATPFIKERFLKINKNTIDINNYPLRQEIESDKVKNYSKKNKVCYIGSISEIRGLIPLIKAIGLCDGIMLDLVGYFPDCKLKEIVKSMPEWKFVNELGFVDRKETLKIKNESIAGIVTFLPTANHINAQPNKIFEYMSAQLPVIGSNFPLWEEIIINNNCGLTVNPNNPNEIAEAIKKIASMPEEAKLMGENGKRAVEEQYNWDIEEKKLINLYNDILI